MLPTPLITLMVAGAGAYVGFRWVAHKGGKLARNLKRAADEVKRSAKARTSGRTPKLKDLGTLTRDPETGDFRPDGSPGDKS